MGSCRWSWTNTWSRWSAQPLHENSMQIWSILMTGWANKDLTSFSRSAQMISYSAKVDQKFLDMMDQHMKVNGEGHLQASLPFKAGLEALLCLITVELSSWGPPIPSLSEEGSRTDGILSYSNGKAHGKQTCWGSFWRWAEQRDRKQWERRISFLDVPLGAYLQLENVDTLNVPSRKLSPEVGMYQKKIHVSLP